MLRRLLDLPLEEIAKISGLSISTIHLLENGDRPLSSEISEKLTKALSVAIIRKLSPDFLFKDLLRSERYEHQTAKI